jgi:hypothetical protein
MARCAACGYDGLVSTPIVYHDPEKELLLTFFPPELGLPVNDRKSRSVRLSIRWLMDCPQKNERATSFSLKPCSRIKH